MVIFWKMCVTVLVKLCENTTQNGTA